MRTSIPLFGAIREAPAHSGFALGRKGFRPFFLLAGVFAVAIVPLWLAALAGAFVPGTTLDPVTWHAHEMIFGFATAVIAGFLLTAVGNWTQRETAVGAPLYGLAVLWLGGRIALALAIPRPLAAGMDLAFLPALAIVLARPLVATKNTRNFVMLVVLAALWAANLAVHLGWRRQGLLFATDVVILLCTIMASRVVPMFTRNATDVPSVRGIPKLDLAAAVAVAGAAIGGVALSEGSLVLRVLCAVAALATAARAVPSLTPKLFRVPLLWILHLAYAWIPIGFALRAIGVAPAIATHALTLGAIGGLTLGMMARVSLGHSGRPLSAHPAVAVSFALVLLAALARVGGALFTVGTDAYRPTLIAAGSFWTAAFAIFVVAYARVLTSPRADGKAG